MTSIPAGIHRCGYVGLILGVVGLGCGPTDARSSRGSTAAAHAAGSGSGGKPGASLAGTTNAGATRSTQTSSGSTEASSTVGGPAGTTASTVQVGASASVTGPGAVGGTAGPATIGGTSGLSATVGPTAAAAGGSTGPGAATGASAGAGTSGTSGGVSTGSSGSCCPGACSGTGVTCDPSTCECQSSSCITGSSSSIPSDAIDLSTVTILNSPNVATWPATTALTTVDVQSAGVRVVFDKQSGVNRWPDFNAGSSLGMVEYTLWLFENIGGQWYASGGIRYAYGDTFQGGPPSGYGVNWFYDPSRWGAMANFQPTAGEQVGFMVTAGDARDSDGTNLQERSNVVVVPLPADTGMDYTCVAGQEGTVSGGTAGGTTSGTSGAASATGGNTSTGGTSATNGTSGGTGNTGPDCCNGACSPATQYCDPEVCQCAAQGSFDLHRAQVYDSPADVANWEVTTSITAFSASGPSFFGLTFDKQGTSCDYLDGNPACDGNGNPNTSGAVDTNRWPDVCLPGWNGGNIQFSLWSVEWINGAWSTSGPIELWCGLPAAGGAPSGFAVDWYYSSRWGPLVNYQPQVGEWVGFFVSAGNARNILGDDPTQSLVFERSNVVFVPFPSDNGESFNF